MQAKRLWVRSNNETELPMLKSYGILENWTKSFQDHDFRSVTGNKDRSLFQPFYERSIPFKAQLLSSLQEDLQLIFKTQLVLVFEVFHIEDMDNRGATYLKARFQFDKAYDNFQLRVEAMLSIDRIILSFDTPELLAKMPDQRTRRILSSFYKQSDFHYMSEMLKIDFSR